MKHRLSFARKAPLSSLLLSTLVCLVALPLPSACTPASEDDEGSGGSGAEAGSSGSSGNGGSSGSAGSGGSGGSSGSAGGGGSGGSTPSNSALQVDLYQSQHTTETCGSAGQSREECLNDCSSQHNACLSAPSSDGPTLPCDVQASMCQSACPSGEVQQEECTYANIYFLVKCNGDNVHALDSDDVTVTIGTRDVGVEGSVLLTQENGLQVDLLLDRSYSIKEANAADTVRSAAKAFIAALPDDARVKVSAFASETVVPEVLGSSGSSYYYSVGTERSALESMVAAQYQPYQSESSAAFTKLFDAAVGLARGATVEGDGLEALPSVAVVFTDGADTASSSYETAAEASAAIGSAKPNMKVYAIGLGRDVDEAALATLAQGRTYSASDKSDLTTVFEDVANQLGAIYRYRVLVPTANYRAQGVLSVDYCGETSVTNFVMDSDGSVDIKPGGPGDSGDGDNTCKYAFDDECDEPTYCEYGTDTADCE